MTYIDSDTCAGDVERSIDGRNVHSVTSAPHWEVGHQRVLDKEEEYQTRIHENARLLPTLGLKERIRRETERGRESTNLLKVILMAQVETEESSRKRKRKS
jgi:hypothetical protein